MAWKVSLNSALRRVTGYSLTQETPEEREQALVAARKQAAARARKRTERRLTSKFAAKEARRREKERRHRAEQAARREERRRVAAERKEAERAEAEKQREAANQKRLATVVKTYDTEMQDILEKVAPRTMTGPAKLVALVEATRYVVRLGIPGDIVECGVWRGGSMQAIAHTLIGQGDTERELHLFDTFEGMPPPTEEDTRTTTSGVLAAEEMLEDAKKDSNLWAIAGLDNVRAGMREVPYPSEQVHFHPGMVEETTPGQAPERIALLRLDTDWYASTKHELEHLYERLSPGGILILDDYGDWDGARKATDEWLERTGEPLFLAPMGGGRIAVKPWTALLGS